jgi:hypothetical protein
MKKRMVYAITGFMLFCLLTGALGCNSGAGSENSQSESTQDSGGRAAPFVTIVKPETGATVNTAQIVVSGKTDGEKVTVNGVEATVSNGSYSATITLAAGPNTITVVATTQSGGEATATVHITFVQQTQSTTGVGATTQ